MKSWLMLLLAGSFIIGQCSLSAAAQWDCYNPQPGHPTATEKKKFIDEMSDLAPSVEQKYGVPAGALAAMAIDESGYGWTRTALGANNLFGWKFYSTQAAGGRASFTLTCQPPEDKNNHYVLFNSRADAVDFVGKKLASLPWYKPATDTYRRARADGTDVRSITLQWVEAIALHYNWKPQQYVQAITRIMNDPLSPSDHISPRQNLYLLSQGAVAAHLPIASSHEANSSPDPDVIYAEQRITPWKSAHCEAPRLDYPRWTGFPVTLCDYTDIGVTVRTYMMNADRSKQAHWTVNACRDAKATNMHACIDYMVKKAKDASSNGIFPIDGYIPEPQDNCYVFRDGVTVWTTLRPHWQPVKDHSCGDFVEAEASLAKAFMFARVSSTTREDYAGAGGTMNVEGLHWVDVIRMLYQQAWTSDRNELMSATAIQAGHNHEF